MEPYCLDWARCKARDPYKVARAKVSAHTFAEIFNSFVEPISYKAMLFTAILVFGCFGISNFVRTNTQSETAKKKALTTLIYRPLATSEDSPTMVMDTITDHRHPRLLKEVSAIKTEAFMVVRRGISLHRA